jgi:DNA polymerase I-like protein with 3'-5' exonuclease and polymerase domains/uracil-DNA glycosylase
MLIGECFGHEDERSQTPFNGASGQELNRLLHEAGLMRSECYLTNLANTRPAGRDLSSWIVTKKKDWRADLLPFRDAYVTKAFMASYERLLREISIVKPNVIVTLGNAPMWALTGATSVAKWRGSCLSVNGNPTQPKLIPTLSPHAVLAQWDSRALVLNDLRRAARERESPEYSNLPDWHFQVRPGFQQVMNQLWALQAEVERGPMWIDFDLETRAGQIACAGLSWSTSQALCIPFMCVERRNGYWEIEEEAEIVYALYRLLTHANARVRWQNGLYDAQYTYRHWHFIPRGAQDTMISQHTAFVALPKGLGFLSSLYSPHPVFWKDDGKTWGIKQSEDVLWAYNCTDCVRTREVGEALHQTIGSLGLEEVEAFQQRLFWPVLQAMTRGIRVDRARRNALAMEIQEAIDSRMDFLTEVLGHPINPKSPVQMVKLFYDDLGAPRQMTRAKKGIPGHLTCDDEALQAIKKKEPLLAPIITAISDLRTLGVFLSTFILARLDVDQRMRCSYNIGGNAGGKSAPYSYRLSSSENAFGGGANLQNIPSEKSKSIGKAKARGMTFNLPNMRSMYVPDPGFTFFDMDLDRADLQVVVWESEDEELKAALRMGVDIHLLNVYSIDGQEPPPYEELVETHPKYPDHRGPRKHKREFAKVFCHATNYGGGARTVAANTGRGIHEIDRAQKAWFAAHPGIKRWHDRTLDQINRYHFVSNKFGYRWHIFDRIDGVLPEALAWVPQSTVGCYINRIWMNIYEQIPEVQVLIQVHDSLAGQFPSHRKAEMIERIKGVSRVVIPYDDPLIIPVGINTSDVSWGDC